MPNLGAVDQIQLVRDLPLNGYALFPTENLHGELQQVISSTQGIANNKKEPIAYRQPFATASIRYANFQKEWQLVEQKQK